MHMTPSTKAASSYDTSNKYIGEKQCDLHGKLQVMPVTRAACSPKTTVKTWKARQQG